MDISKYKLGVYPDLLLLLMVLTFSTVVSSSYMSSYIKNGIKPDFYQNIFGPAVLDTCGRGFQIPILKEGSPLKEFLDLKKDHFSCKDLEGKLSIRVGLNTLVSQTQYLMKLVSWTWSVRGISWSALAPLFSIFYSLNIAILYCLFRLGMGRGMAFMGSALLCISWVHLTYLPHLRDYSKATFILALIFILGCLIKWGNRRIVIVSLSTCFGVITGIGLGFRLDILICIPPFIVSLFFLLPCGVKSNIRTKLEGLSLSFILMIATGWGPLSYMQQGQNGWHVALLGLAPYFTDALGLKESIYQWISKYDDKTVQAMASIYSYNRDLVYAFVSTSNYDKITADYFLEFAKIFPADFLIRVLGSFVGINNLSFVALENQTLGNQSTVEMLYRGRQTLMAPFISWGLGPVVIALLLQSAYKIRFAIFSILFLFYFSAVQTLQFHVRHYFYLEFIFLWSLGFLFHHLFVRARESIREIYIARNEKKVWNEIIWPKDRRLATLTRPLKFFGIVLLIIFGFLYGLRQYQEDRLKELFLAYENAELVPLKWQVVSQSNNSNLTQVKDFIDKNSFWPRQNNIAYGFQYLVVEFNPQCESSSKSSMVEVKFINGYKNELVDLIKNYKVIIPPIEKKSTRVFYPVHSWHDERGIYTFKELRLNARDVTCLKGMYKVKKPLSLSPLTFILSLPPDWETRELYLSIK
ncbi:MAG: hypothetical protein ACQ9MH_00005 [Nitrospinales bacterium]